MPDARPPTPPSPDGPDPRWAAAPPGAPASVPRDAGDARGATESPGAPPLGQERPRSLWPIAFTIVALALIAAISAGAWWVASGLTAAGSAVVDRATGVVREAVSPRVIRQEVLTILLDRPDHTPKLVVMTQPVRVVIERTDELRWLYVYWGTSSARLEIAGNRVQWFVDLSGIGEQNIVVNEAAGNVTLYVPPPRLDREMVAVQTNPLYVRQETDRGWARLPASAQRLADDARRRIVPTILAAADTPDTRSEASRAAAAAVEQVVRPLLSPYLREHGLTLRVEVGEPPASPPAGNPDAAATRSP